jgi:hypothetical protein
MIKQIRPIRSARATATDLRPLRQGERTRRQSGGLRAGSCWFGIRGYDDADVAFPPTLHNFHRMLNNPTIALAMAVKVAPILASSWSWKIREGTPNGEAIRDWVQSVFDPLRPQMLPELLRALGSGCKSLELIWEVVNRPLPGVPAVRWEIVKTKSLSVFLTRVLIENDHGRFAGVNNAGVELGPGEVLHYPFDMRDGNWYGRPLLENMRHEFYELQQDRIESQKLVKKLSAIIPIIKVLKGLALDENGNPVDRYTAALELIKGLAQAKGIAFESIANDATDIRNNPELLKISDMDIEVLDLGSTTPAVSAMLERRKQFQQEFMQGMLLPPRAALEAQHSSKADAEEHGDVGEIHAELVHQDVTRHVNWYAVDPMLAYNLGEQYRGAVYAEAAPIRDRNRALLKSVLDKLLTNVATVDFVMSLMDDEAILEQLDIPTRKRPLDLTTDLPLPDPQPDNVPAPAANRIGLNFRKANKALAASRQRKKPKKAVA